MTVPPGSSALEIPGGPQWRKDIQRDIKKNTATMERMRKSLRGLAGAILHLHRISVETNARLTKLENAE